MSLLFLTALQWPTVQSSKNTTCITTFFISRTHWKWTKHPRMLWAIISSIRVQCEVSLIVFYSTCTHTHTHTIFCIEQQYLVCYYCGREAKCETTGLEEIRYYIIHWAVCEFLIVNICKYQVVVCRLKKSTPTKNYLLSRM